MNKTLNITLRGLDCESPTALKKLLIDHKITPKKVQIVTYTLSLPAVIELNAIVATGGLVTVVYNRLIDCDYTKTKFHFTARQNNEVHSKLWIIDGRFFVGSTNLTSDTIGNLMIECTTSRQKLILQRHFNRAYRREMPKSTEFVL